MYIYIILYFTLRETRCLLNELYLRYIITREFNIIYQTQLLARQSIYPPIIYFQCKMFGEGFFRRTEASVQTHGRGKRKSVCEEGRERANNENKYKKYKFYSDCNDDFFSNSHNFYI